MNMKEESITTLVEKALKEVKKFGCNDCTYKVYEQYYNSLIEFYKTKDVKYYSYEISVLFLKEKWNIDIIQGHFKHNQTIKCRATKILDDVFKQREPKKQYYYTAISLSDNNQILLNKYIEYNQKIGLSNENIKNIRRFISTFLKYLEEGKMSIQKLGILKVNEYLSSFKSINQLTLKNYIFILKKFLCYLFENNIIDKKLENQLPNIKKTKNSKLPSVWNFNELNQVINSINRTTNKGKRDYAIIILAITTALRGCDIINLKLNNVDFKNNIIKFMQMLQYFNILVTKIFVLIVVLNLLFCLNLML